MINRTRKLRWRRRLKRSQNQVGELGQQAEDQLEKHVIKRLHRVVGVRRFILSWVGLWVLLAGIVFLQMQGLSGYYQKLAPVPGGTYTEGILGSFTNANPIYATGSVDAAASRLVFSSLMQYNSNNELVGDLATKLDANVSADEYTVHLRSNAKWHDGRPVTADDVVFTFQTIQNPDAKSPLLPNWQDIKIVAKDSRTVTFTLPHGLASFPHSLTTGIVPKHILSDIPASQLRTVAFNTVRPIGSGPFKWRAVQVNGNTPETREEQIGLTRNETYYDGAPLLENFTIRAFRNEESLLEALEARELSGASGLETLQDSIRQKDATTTYDIPLMGEVLVFMRNSSPFLEDAKVRQALTRATNRAEIITGLGYPVIAADNVLLKSHVGYDPKIVQLGYNPIEARKLLDKAGWKKLNADGIRTKGNQELTIRLYSKSNSQYSFVASKLQQQWRQVGVKLDVVLQSEEDLQGTIAFHNYDVLLYGITLGSDPDVYAYWHSSQADPRSLNRLNFSEYKSSIADQALEGGRSRVDPDLRAIKYKPLLQRWRADAPAVALYQPRYLYVTTEKLYGFEPTKLNAPVDRFANVQNWAVREAPTTLE